MKYRTLLILAVAALGISPAVAGSSSPKLGTDGGSSIVNAEAMPRARIWYASRVWQNRDGVILVCEEHFITSYYNEKKCYAKGDKDESGRWSTLPTKHDDGFVLKGYEYRFVGTNASTILIAYYGPPEKVKSEVAKVESDFTKVDRDFVVNGGNITIKANRVIVQRKK